MSFLGCSVVVRYKNRSAFSMLSGHLGYFKIGTDNYLTIGFICKEVVSADPEDLLSYSKDFYPNVFKVR